jgi:hypothetical protein
MRSFSSVKIEGNKSAADYIYYNGTVINNSLDTTQQADDPQVTFEDQRQNALVPDSSDYEVSVENFSLNGCTITLPLFIPQIANPSVDVNRTIYTVTVSVYDGTNYLSSTENIIWVSENLAPFTVIPTVANPRQIETDYYYCYSYTHMVDLINNALKKAWLNIGGGTAAFGTQCPFMEFSPASGLFYINQDTNTTLVPYGTALPQPYRVTSTVGTSASGGTYQAGEYSFVGMNTVLNNLFSTFPSIYYSFGPRWANQPTLLPEVVIDTGLLINLQTGLATNPADSGPVGITLRTEPKSSVFQLINPYDGTGIPKAFFARLPQDFTSTGSIWSPVASIVLATTKIPVRNEATANPVTFGDANVGSQIANGGAFQKVLIETPIDCKSADIWKGFIFYEPKTETESSLDPSHDGISNIDIILYWRNRLTNSLTPIRVANQGSMSFRLVFKRK